MKYKSKQGEPFKLTQRGMRFATIIAILLLGMFAQTAGAQDVTPTPNHVNTGNDAPIKSGNACDGVPTPTMVPADVTPSADEVHNPCYQPFPPCGQLAFNIAIEAVSRHTEFVCDTTDGSFKGSAACAGTKFVFEGESKLEHAALLNAHLTCPGVNQDDFYTGVEKCTNEHGEVTVRIQFLVTKHFDEAPVSLVCNPSWAATPTS